MLRPVSSRSVDETKQWLAGVFDRAAPTYDHVGPSYHEHFGRSLVELAEIAPGARVLDVACGRGAVLVPAASHVGVSGHVVGVDISEEMIRLARQALDKAELTNGETRVMDAESLAFPDGSFDAVLCGFGIFFFPDPERAASEFVRVLRPNGTVGVSAWAEEDPRWAWERDLMEKVRLARRAVVRAFDSEEALKRLLDGAGFAAVRIVEEQLDVSFVDEEQWWSWKWSFSHRGLLEQMEAADLILFKEEAFARMTPLRDSQGYPMRLKARFAVARKPM